MVPSAEMPDFATDVYIVMGITLPVATLALVLRLIARRMTRAKYSYDDILAVMSLVCSRPERVAPVGLC